MEFVMPLKLSLIDSPIFPINLVDNTVFVDLDKMPPNPTQTAQEKEKQRQVVETERTEQAKPKEAKYLGEHDQSVEKESKAKQVEHFRKGGSPAKAGSNLGRRDGILE